MDTTTLNLAKKYAEKLIRGEGAIQGKNGQDGKSAYEIAVENGYTGTEAEFGEGLAENAETMTREEMLAILNGGGN